MTLYIVDILASYLPAERHGLQGIAPKERFNLYGTHRSEVLRTYYIANFKIESSVSSSCGI